MHKILITNNLTKRKEIFTPVNPKQVKMYACGVTVYDHCHIGHAMQAIFFEVIRNFLEHLDFEVTYVRNYTDIDDKIIKRAQEMGISPLRLSSDMIASESEDIKNLGLKGANFTPKVSDYIPEIIAMITGLIEKNAAYPSQSGDVYYRVRQKKDYGKLSNRNLDELISGSRDLVEGEKEDPLDFALWKNDQTEDASWASPWGVGRPGWHIECSVMAKKFLGDTFDIHGGGRDLMFPHHENEIAQSESANTAPFANYWIHSGLMTINEQKMSKSLGNHISIKDFLRDWPAEVLKIAVLSHHYASNIDFSQKVFQKALGRLIYYYETLLRLDALGNTAVKTALLPGFSPQEIEESFKKSMCEDFNTATTLALLNKEFKKAQEIFSKKISPERDATAAQLAAKFRELGAVLTLFQEDPKIFVANLKERYLKKINISADEVKQNIVLRNEARLSKYYAQADEIRNKLMAWGLILRDSPEGTEWMIDINQMES